jgi:hypothetical protein
MKKLVSILILSVVLYSCNNNSQKSAAAATDSTGIKPAVALKSSEVDGLWTGIFSNSAEDEATQKKADAFEKAYYEKLYGTQKEGEEYEGDYDAIMDVKVIPAELRKAYYMEPLNGYYARRAPNKISLIIDGITEAGELNGRSICAGNERPVKGMLEKANDGYKATLKEPGDDKNDGTFNVSFYTAAKKLTGSWQSQSGDVKPIMLTKANFKYDAKAGEITGFRQKNKDGAYLEFKKNPSTDLLTTADVENLTRPEISILRNLIFARHGYTFASAAFRNYFERDEWYVPYKKDIRSDLTDTEKKNADKLKSYEKYAADTYDEFGR